MTSVEKLKHFGKWNFIEWKNNLLKLPIFPLLLTNSVEMDLIPSSVRHSDQETGLFDKDKYLRFKQIALNSSSGFKSCTYTDDLAHLCIVVVS